MHACRSTLEDPTAHDGYLWSFPRPDHLAIGVCAPAASGVTADDLRAHSLRWIASHGLGADSGPVPYAWPIPSVGTTTADAMRCAGPGWMLTGDAAGLVDPLTREGIYYALLSGRWAADALGRTSLDEAPRAYAARLREEVHPELARAARLSHLFFMPAFSTLLLEGLRHSSAIREVFADLVSGTQPYRGLRRRLLATRQWSLAARAIRLGFSSGFAGTMRRQGVPHPSSTV